MAEQQPCTDTTNENTEEFPGRNVLVPVDGSEYSEKAFYYCFLCKSEKKPRVSTKLSSEVPKGYVDHLRREGDVVLIAHCLEYPPMPEKRFPYAYDYFGEWKEQIESLRTKAKVLLHHFQAICKEKQIKSRSIILDGHKPGPIIVEEAVNEKVDTIVIGARGLGKIRRTVLGSVTDYVVHHSPVPVTVVPPESWKHHYPYH